MILLVRRLLISFIQKHNLFSHYKLYKANKLLSSGTDKGDSNKGGVIAVLDSNPKLKFRNCFLKKFYKGSVPWQFPKSASNAIEGLTKKILLISAVEIGKRLAEAVDYSALKRSGFAFIEGFDLIEACVNMR